MTFFGVRPAGWLGDDPAPQVAQILDWAVHAEDAGFDVLFVGDRLLSSASARSGSGVYEASMLDPFVLLAGIAALTRRIRLATLVAVVTFRHPAAMAKLTASLDVLSGGRFVLGAGSGWSAPELELFGVERRRRGAQLEVALEIIRALWAGGPVSGDDDFWAFADVRVAPRPVQRPGPPVWLASFAPEDSMAWTGSLSAVQRSVLARIGRIADGWAPLTYSASHKRQLDPEQLGLGWEAISEAALGAGRDPSRIDIIYPHWIAITRNERELAACERALARFFTGTFEEAKATYLIGDPDEIAAQIRAHTRLLPRVDGYLFTPLSDDPEQLDVIARELRPQLE